MRSICVVSQIVQKDWTGPGISTGGHGRKLKDLTATLLTSHFCGVQCAFLRHTSDRAPFAGDRFGDDSTPEKAKSDKKSGWDVRFSG